MNGNARDDATGRPISLNNEATPDAAVFDGTSLVTTAGATAGDDAGAARGGGGLYCNRMETIRVSKKRTIIIYIERMTRIVMRKEFYRMNSN